MPINFLNNYPESNVFLSITDRSGKTLFGEAWLYQQFLDFKNNGFIDENDTWFFYHNYNLSNHPGSKGKVEGQIDFLLLNKNGLLLIEVKGGGIRVEDGQFVSFNSDGSFYQAQNPFVQVKDYVHTIKDLIANNDFFVYKAIVFPHTRDFKLLGPELSGYNYCFYSFADFCNLESDYAKNKNFFEFINNLPVVSKRKIIQRLNPNWLSEKINRTALEKYPVLKNEMLRRLKNELFPNQDAYGYNPQKLNEEIILNENFEILRGLQKNKCILVQGKPGTGKTVIAQKYIAENFLRQKKGVLFCANKLVRAQLENILIHEYKLNTEYIQFRIFTEQTNLEMLPSEIDYLIFDEAQEYFEKGLFEFLEKCNLKYLNPNIFLLYDINQTVFSDSQDMSFYEDFFIENGYTHYYFDQVHRCSQDSVVFNACKLLKENSYEKLKKLLNHNFQYQNDDLQKLTLITSFIDDNNFIAKDKIILVDFNLIDEFKALVSSYFKNDIEELTEYNIGVASSKIRFSTPIKFRGLEKQSVLLLCKELAEKSKSQIYIGATRAIKNLFISIWK